MPDPVLEKAAAPGRRAEMPLLALPPEVDCARELGGGWMDETGTTRNVGLVHRRIKGGPGYFNVTMAIRPHRPRRREAAWWVAHMGIIRPEIERSGGLEAAVDALMREEWEPIAIPIDGRPVLFDVVRRARVGGRWRDYWGACTELEPGFVVSLAGANVDPASTRLATVADLEPFIDGTRKILEGPQSSKTTSE